MVLKNVRVIETDGTEIIAVKRTDVKLDSKKGRELAIADNQTAKAGIEFDFDVIADLSLAFDTDFAKDWEMDMFGDEKNDFTNKELNESDLELNKPICCPKCGFEFENK